MNIYGEKLVRTGQVQKGMYLAVGAYNSTSIRKVKEVLFAGSIAEEIILNKKRNQYFLTRMLLEHSSWVQDAYIVVIDETSES